MSSQDWILVVIKLVFAVLAVIMVVVFLVRPILRALVARPEIMDFTQSFSASEQVEMDELEIPAGGEKPGRKEMIDEARADPRKTAALVSAWLKDKRK